MKIISALFRKRRNNESYFKYIFGLLHLWFGIPVGILICILGLSGAIFSLHEEFDRIENGDLWELEQPVKEQASIDQVIADFKDEHGKPWRVIVPIDSAENISVTKRPIGFDRQMHFYHRGTGEYLGMATNYSEGIAVTMVQIHRWFMLPNQKLGTQIGAVATIIFIFLLISGIILWFPTTLQRAKQNLSLALSGSFRKINWNIHINYGFYFTFLLLVISFSGLCITYPTLRAKTLNAFKGENPVKKEKVKRPVRKVRYDYYKSLDKSRVYDRMFAVADLKLDYDSDAMLYFPPPHLPEHTIFKVNPDNWMGGKWQDMSTFNKEGKYKRTYYFDDMRPYQKLNNLISSIHKGEIFGTWSRVLYVLMGLFTFYLPVSGFIIWWKRVKKKLLA